MGRFGRVPTLIEWDDNIPDFEVLAATADEARQRCESALAYQGLRELKEHGFEAIPEFALPAYHRA